ncbi:MAG: VanZ family protein [Candidatus Limnocylindria bacterium]
MCEGSDVIRFVSAIGLAIWLGTGLVLTLQPAHPLPGQVVEHNLVPLRTFALYLDNLGSDFWMRQALGNLLLLLPVGLLGPHVLPWLDRWWRILPAAALVSLGIETIQLWVPNRSFDVDDVMLNAAGALLGFAGYRMLSGSSSR